MVPGPIGQQKRPRSYPVALWRRRCATAANDNGGAAKGEVAALLGRRKGRKAHRSRPVVPRSGRRFLPIEVKRARWGFYAIFGLLLGLWLAAVVGLLAFA